MRLLSIVAAGLVLAGCAEPKLAPTEEDIRAAEADVPAVECPPPVLPPAVAQAHLAGTTQVEVEVDMAGAVKSATVVGKSGNTPAHALADDAVVNAVKQCRFPLMRGTAGGTRKGIIPIDWKG